MEAIGPSATDPRARAMFFVTTDEGCFVPLSHKLNPDGYLRKSWGPARVPAERHMEMFHRFIFRAHKGPIPDGYDVDHMCSNRACCNPEHLRAMEGGEHAAYSNRMRSQANQSVINSKETV